jgi:microcystin-dependent protein
MENEMDGTIGTIQLVAFNYNPQGWYSCDGAMLSVKNHTPLFALIGCTYGGDGRDTFALPKLESPMKGLHYIICNEGVWPTRD